MKVPAFLLRRLYVRGSLRITVDGFEFQLRNRLGSGYANQLVPLALDGQELDLASSSFVIDGVQTAFEAVSSDMPFTLAMNKTTTITYSGGKIEPGAHKVSMGFEVAGLGQLAFDFTDDAIEA